MKTGNYLKVVLDENATILDFECTLLDLMPYTKEEVIGKNWFEMFIADVNTDEVMNVFRNAFEHEGSAWRTYKNDIKWKDGNHYLIDFENSTAKVKGKTVVIAIGRNYYTAK